MTAHDVEAFVVGHLYRTEARVVPDSFFVDVSAADVEPSLRELPLHMILDRRLAAADRRTATQLGSELELPIERAVDRLGDGLGGFSFHRSLFPISSLPTGGVLAARKHSTQVASVRSRQRPRCLTFLPRDDPGGGRSRIADDRFGEHDEVGADDDVTAALEEVSCGQNQHRLTSVGIEGADG